MKTECVEIFDEGNETYLVTREEIKPHVIIRIWKLVTTIREPPFDETRAVKP